MCPNLFEFPWDSTRTYSAKFQEGGKFGTLQKISETLRFHSLRLQEKSETSPSIKFFQSAALWCHFRMQKVSLCLKTTGWKTHDTFPSRIFFYQEEDAAPSWRILTNLEDHAEERLAEAATYIGRDITNSNKQIALGKSRLGRLYL